MSNTSNLVEVFAILNIISWSYKANEISRKVGLEPSMTKEKNEGPRNLEGRFKNSTLWRLESKSQGENAFSESIEKLLDKIEGSGKELRSFPPGDIVQIWVPVYSEDTTTLLELDCPVLKRLSAMGIPVHIEFYSMGIKG